MSAASQLLCKAAALGRVLSLAVVLEGSRVGKNWPRQHLTGMHASFVCLSVVCMISTPGAHVVVCTHVVVGVPAV